MSVIKHTDPVPDPRAVNQDKKNMLFSVSTPPQYLKKPILDETILLWYEVSLLELKNRLS